MKANVLYIYAGGIGDYCMTSHAPYDMPDRSCRCISPLEYWRHQTEPRVTQESRTTRSKLSRWHWSSALMAANRVQGHRIDHLPCLMATRIPLGASGIARDEAKVHVLLYDWIKHFVSSKRENGNRFVYTSVLIYFIVSPNIELQRKLIMPMRVTTQCHRFSVSTICALSSSSS